MQLSRSGPSGQNCRVTMSAGELRNALRKAFDTTAAVDVDMPAGEVQIKSGGRYVTISRSHPVQVEFVVEDDDAPAGAPVST